MLTVGDCVGTSVDNFTVTTPVTVNVDVMVGFVVGFEVVFVDGLVVCLVVGFKVGLNVGFAVFSKMFVDFNPITPFKLKDGFVTIFMKGLRRFEPKLEQTDVKYKIQIIAKNIVFRIIFSRFCKFV
jgi:hypothetical protein